MPDEDIQSSSFSREHSQLLVLLVTVTILLISAGFLLFYLFPFWHWIHYPLHSLIAGLGAFIALYLAGILLRFRLYASIIPSYFWVACALLAMGLLDAFHTVTYEGQTFVWFHSNSHFIGGILFACVWLTKRPSAQQAVKKLPLIIIIFITAFGILSMIFPESIPLMKDDKGFTVAARGLNIIGGFGFLAATGYFVLFQDKRNPVYNAMLASFCLLSGIAGILFNISKLWGSTWWEWHIVRLTAYGIAFYYIQLLHQSERKKAEEELRESEYRFRQLSNSSFEGIVFHDRGEILDSNKTFADMFGYQSAELLGKDKFKLITRESREKIGEIIFSESPRPYETTGIRKDGSFFPIEVRGETATYKGRKVRVAAVRDITERKNAEEKIAAGQKRFIDTINTIPDILFALDKNRNLEMWNRSLEKVTGYTKKELSEMSPEDFFSKKEVIKVKKALSTVMEKGYTEIELLLVTKNGTAVPYHYTAASMRNADGKVTGITGVGRDMTELRKTQEQIESISKFPSENPDPVLRINANCDIIYRNEAVNDLLKRSGISEENILEILPDNVKSLIDQALKERRSFYVIDNEVREEVYSYNLVPTPESGYVNFYGRNITERKKAEKKLKNAYTKLKETQQQLIQSSKMAAMGQLAAGISHELNQPLTGIKGFAQTVLMDLDKESPFRTDLDKIVAQADRMDKIIKHIRMFARKTEFALKPMDINEAVENALMLLGAQLQIHNITVKGSLSEDLPEILGDINQLEQVALNLITNARDAIDERKDPNGGVIRIKSSLCDDRKSVSLTFKDTGCGIPRENLDDIFNPFFTTKSPDGGTGLGLSIVYRIIEDHNGSIKVSSKNGAGTTFRITLPVA